MALRRASQAICWEGIGTISGDGEEAPIRGPLAFFKAGSSESAMLQRRSLATGDDQRVYVDSVIDC